MQWNHETNLPVEGSYRHLEYDREAFRKYVEETYPYPEILEALESVDYDWEAFFLQKKNAVIEEGCSFYLDTMMRFGESSLGAYWLDMGNGYWALPEGWGNEADIYRRFFFCETEEELWEFLSEIPDAHKMWVELLGCFRGRWERIFDLPISLEDWDRCGRFVDWCMECNAKREAEK